MTLVTSPQQPQYASTTGADKRTDDLRRRNIAETNPNINGRVGAAADVEKEDKVKEKVNNF